MQAANDEQLGMFSSFGPNHKKKKFENTPAKLQDIDNSNISGCFPSVQLKDQINEKPEVAQEKPMIIQDDKKEEAELPIF